MDFLKLGQESAYIRTLKELKLLRELDLIKLYLKTIGDQLSLQKINQFQSPVVRELQKIQRPLFEFLPEKTVTRASVSTQKKDKKKTIKTFWKKVALLKKNITDDGILSEDTLDEIVQSMVEDFTGKHGFSPFKKNIG